MKTLIIVLFSFTQLLIAQQKISIAVLSLQGNGISPSEAVVLTDELRSVLVQAGKYNVLERNNMESILQEQGFQMSGCTSAECAVEAGKLLGVQKMIAGSVGKLGTLYNINIRIIDVETGKIEKTESKRHEGSIEDLLDLIKQIGYDLSDANVTEETKQSIQNEQSQSIDGLNTFIKRRTKFSIKIGINTAKTTRQSADKIGFLVGGALGLRIYNQIMIQPEFYYSTRNINYLTDETMQFENIQFALLLSYQVVPFSSRLIILNFNAGPSYNYVLNATKKAYGETFDLKNYDDTNVIENSEFSFTFGPGLGFYVKTILVSIECRYEVGLTHIFKDESNWEGGNARVLWGILGLTF